VAEHYVDWAVNQGLAVLDVNVPRHMTESMDPNGVLDSDSAEAKTTLNHELMQYVWDNYVE
jgi:histone deacetylase 6